MLDAQPSRSECCTGGAIRDWATCICESACGRCGEGASEGV